MALKRDESIPDTSQNFLGHNTMITKFRDIPQFPKAHYQVNVGLSHLEEHLDYWDRPESPLILDPDFQRGHVWTKQQQSSFMEYFLKGGETGRNLYFNCSSWMSAFNTPVYCVDGLQRITAALAFMHDEIKVFGRKMSEFEDKLPINNYTFVVNMLKIRNKKELLSIYVDFNSGGTPHNPQELKRVAQMIKETNPEDTL